MSQNEDLLKMMKGMLDNVAPHQLWDMDIIQEVEGGAPAPTYRKLLVRNFMNVACDQKDPKISAINALMDRMFGRVHQAEAPREDGAIIERTLDDQTTNLLNAISSTHIAAPVENGSSGPAASLLEVSDDGPFDT